MVEKILTPIFAIGMIAVGLLFLLWVLSDLVSDIKRVRRYSSSRFRKLKNKFEPKAKTDYPYLPLDMVTKHFGWSYEYEKYHGWNYFIWYVRDDGTTINVNSFNDGSRSVAIEDCKKLEEYFYGKGENQP